MSAIDQKEYLKRYLSNGDGEEKKKKKRRKKLTGNPTAAKAPRSAFIDDDVDIRGLAKLATEDESRLLQDADEAPLVAAYIDERPEEEVLLEEYRSSNKWKSVVQDKDEQSTRGRNTDGVAFLRRKPRHDFSPDISPQRHQRHDSDSDLSPPRGRPGHPQKKGRHDSDSDLSPAGENCEVGRSKRRYESNSDSSSQRRLKGKSSRERVVTSRQDSDSDLSPARARAYSPSRRNRERLGPRHDSDSDLSPPRGDEGGRARSGDCDLPSSRERAHRGASSRHKHGQDCDSGMPPMRKQERSERRGQRKRMDSDSDLSPDRGKKDQSSDRDKMKPTKTLSGAKAGLSDAAALRRENEASRRRTDEAYSKLTDDVSGKNAETIFRDKSGRKRDLKAERRFKREEEERRAEEDEKFMQWGKGLAQIKNQKDQVEDMVKEMAKPLARYKDDADLDEMLKEKDREGDPMLAFLKKKESKARAKAGIKEKPKYRGPKPAPSRFGIEPGYRWDGVDRSNGFEKKYFQRQSDKRATSEMAYKWSVEDM